MKANVSKQKKNEMMQEAAKARELPPEPDLEERLRAAGFTKLANMKMYIPAQIITHIKIDSLPAEVNSVRHFYKHLSDLVTPSYLCAPGSTLQQIVIYRYLY